MCKKKQESIVQKPRKTVWVASPRCGRGLIRAALGSPAERAALVGVGVGGGGNITVPPPTLLTHEPVAVARLARRQSKALNEYFPRELKKSQKGNKPGQGQVKGQNGHFSPYRLLRCD